CGFTIAVVGSTTNLITGWNELDLPAWSSGYIYWPAVGVIAIISMLSVPIGAKLAYHLPTNILRRFFALFVFLTGVRMLWS
ncbi:MAG: TSUP family transporter, partial [Gammaproteobacteria bacterium]